MNTTDLDTLSNGYMTAVVSPFGGTSRAGSVIELIDHASGIDFADGGNYASVHCGDYEPVDGTITHVSDACCIFESSCFMNSMGVILPVSLVTTYRLTGRGLELSFEITTTGTAEISEPMEADFGLKPYLDCFIKYSNQTVDQDRRNSLNGSHETFRISGDQEILLYGPTCPVDTRYIFPNPSKALIALSADEYPDNEYMSIRFFDTEPPLFHCAGPDLHSLLGPDNQSEYYVRMGIEDDQVPIYFSDHPNGWERSASWIMDEIPMIHPHMGYMWRYSETSTDTSEYVSASTIRLLEDHPTMNMNIVVLPDGILEPNCDSMWYEPGHQDSWSHWHDTWRVSTEAPQDYKQWMCNIQNDVYPWADRVNLGCHGYHHTPSPDSAWDPYHEFITFELEEHQERFDMIQSDFADIGLDPQMTSRTMRPSGNEMSLSALWAMIDHGFEYYSNGARWMQWQAGEWFYDFYLTKYETPNGRIWGANTVWWADATMMMEYDKLSTVMERGKYGLLGGHPARIFLNNFPEHYNRIDSLCTSLEVDYPYFGWIMPVDFSSFMEELYTTTVDSIRGTERSARMYFTGQTSYGQTVVCKIPAPYTNLEVFVDGSSAYWEDHGDGRIFVDADGLTDASHYVSLSWDYTGIDETVSPIAGGPILTMPNPAPASACLGVTGLQPGSAADISILDLAGRAVSSFSAEPSDDGSFSSDLQLPPGTPAGVYFIRVSQGACSTCMKVIILD